MNVCASASADACSRLLAVEYEGAKVHATRGHPDLLFFEDGHALAIPLHLRQVQSRLVFLPRHANAQLIGMDSNIASMKMLMPRLWPPAYLSSRDSTVLLTTTPRAETKPNFNPVQFQPDPQPRITALRHQMSDQKRLFRAHKHTMFWMVVLAPYCSSSLTISR